MARVLVTGGQGFLGRYIAEALRAAHDVTVTDRTSLDVLDPSACLAALRRAGPELVCHLAALCGAQPSAERPQEYFAVNALGTVHLLEACRATGVRQFILTSSLTVHGAGEEAMTEASPYAPRHPYAASKVAAEVMTRAYARYGIRSVILRPTLVVGPGCKEGHAIGDFTEIARRAGTIQLFGGGRHRRDFVHPEDVASAFAAAVGLLGRGGFESRTYNLSTGAPVTMAELAARVVALVGQGRTEVAATTGQAFSLFTSIARAGADLGWRPQHTTDDIVRSLLAAIEVRSG